MSDSKQSAKPKEPKAKPTASPPSLVSLVVLPFSLTPVIFAALLFVARTCATFVFTPDPHRPPFLTLPLIGASLFPGVFGTSIYLIRSRFLRSIFPSFLATFICVLPIFLVGVHNFLTVFYGNINNDSWSDSIMIDVVGPPSLFKTFTQIPVGFQPATNAAVWANKSILDGPHIDIDGIHAATCPERMFARFMYHRITPRARIHALLADKVMFGGIWLMAVGTDPARLEAPKVFTDFAYGNDVFFNNIIRWLLVDEFNWYSVYRFETSSLRWDIDSGLIAPYNNESVSIRTAVGAELSSRLFVMDQYSCMAETLWLNRFMGVHWCFYKKMESGHSYDLSGTMKHPLLTAGNIEFPTGRVDDCSKPYVRAVLAADLHWIRPTYEC